MDRKFEEQAQEYLEKEILKEDYCPHCGQHSRLIKVFECSERWWRCLSCMGLINIASIPVKSSAVPRWTHENPRSEDVEAYLKMVKKEEKEEEERKKRIENGGVLSAKEILDED
jgi:hypothetical protein